MTWRIRALDEKHDRQGFGCGVEALDQWLQKQARQSVKKRLASVWVVSPEDEPTVVAGYYSLAPYQVDFDECPDKLRKRLPRYPLAMMLLARLAVSSRFQRQGLGGILLLDALNRSWRASQTVPVQAVLVHAKDENAASFYRSQGLLAFPTEPLHLYMPMASIERLLTE